MPGVEYLIEEPSVQWTEPMRPDRKGRGFLQKNLADGEQGRPFAGTGRQPEGFLNPAHLHTEPQFQVLLDGTMSFPTKPLKAIAVHYSDAYVPYGPFLVGPGMQLAVVRRRRAAQFYMADPEGRKHANGRGRELYGQSNGVPWEELSESLPRVRRKVLFQAGAEPSPEAVMWEYPSQAVINRGPALFGRFHILLKGSVQVGDRELQPYSMLFERGGNWSSVLRAGAAGATWLTLAFDRE